MHVGIRTAIAAREVLLFHLHVWCVASNAGMYACPGHQLTSESVIHSLRVHWLRVWPSSQTCGKWRATT